jgi:DNA-binding NarL/FixJ family response regulator
MKRPAHLESPPVRQITVLLAEDHASFRKSLKLLAEQDAGIKVIGEASSGREAVSLTLSLHPDVVVMDIAMPLLNGLEATCRIMETAPATRVLMLTAHPEPEYVRQAMLFGASGYMLKQSSTQFLARAVRAVNKGGTYFSSSFAKALCDQSRKLFNKGESLKKKAAQSARPAPHRGV